jgi:hypothetical protein
MGRYLESAQIALNLPLMHASLKRTNKEDALNLVHLIAMSSLKEPPIVPIPIDEEWERRGLIAPKVPRVSIRTQCYP